MIIIIYMKKKRMEFIQELNTNGRRIYNKKFIIW